MPEVAIGTPRLYVERGWPAVGATIDANGRRFDVYFRTERGPLSTDAGPFVLPALAAAMKLETPIRSTTPLSSSFQALAWNIQDSICYFYFDMHHVAIEAPQAAGAGAALAGPADERGVGLFFSGGVDSFYSLLKHRDEITHLIYVRGFDTLLARPDLLARNVRALRQAAAELGKPLIEVETNLRIVLDAYKGWTHQMCTAAQLAVVLVLRQQFKKVYIGEDYPYSGEQKLADLPIVRGADTTQAVFDGMDAFRLDKVMYVATSPVALRWLRVCWQNKGAYNCCRCEKCLCTMIGCSLRCSFWKERKPD